MPTYIILANLTEQGIKTIKDSPSRVEKTEKDLKKLGGKLVAYYTVMGEYDDVAIIEAPSDEVIMGYLLNMGASGNIKTQTLKAFTKEELAKAVKGSSKK